MTTLLIQQAGVAPSEDNNCCPQIGTILTHQQLGCQMIAAFKGCWHQKPRHSNCHIGHNEGHSGFFKGHESIVVAPSQSGQSVKLHNFLYTRYFTLFCFTQQTHRLCLSKADSATQRHSCFFSMLACVVSLYWRKGE